MRDASVSPKRVIRKVKKKEDNFGDSGIPVNKMISDELKQILVTISFIILLVTTFKRRYSGAANKPMTTDVRMARAAPPLAKNIPIQKKTQFQLNVRGPMCIIYVIALPIAIDSYA